MRRILAFVPIMLAAAVHPASAPAQGGSVLAPMMLFGRGEAVRNLPYILEEIAVRVQTLPDGSHITSTDREKQLRDAQGRMRTEIYTQREGQMILRSVQLWDPDSRSSVTLVASNKTAQVRHMPDPRPQTPEQQARREEMRAQAAARRATANSGSAASQGPAANARPRYWEVVELPPRTILGVHAEGKRMTHIIPAGTIGNDHELSTVQEIWSSPELHIDLDQMTEDYTMSRKVVTVISLDRVEANPALFDIPADYTIIEPKQGSWSSQ